MSLIEDYKSIATRIDECMEIVDRHDEIGPSGKEETSAYYEARGRVGMLADAFGIVRDQDGVHDPDPLDREEIDEAMSLLLRGDIPEALIHIERAAPDALSGLADKVSRYFGRTS